MALREIRKIGDDILRKKSRVVEKVDDRIRTILDDMVETMYHANGVGLAAPQIGLLKRLIVVDIGDGPIKIVNPVIIEKDGEQVDEEGCLSVPGTSGAVRRPSRVKVRGLNENGDEIIIEAEDFLARAFCHEVDHLDGILYVDLVEKTEE